jgi:N-glycosylase/DNA lyase
MLGTIRVSNFSLFHTLNSGQVFRWRQQGDLHMICAQDRMIQLTQADSFLSWEDDRPDDEEFLRMFFALDQDLAAVHAGLIRRGFPSEMLTRWPGIHITRQDPWESLLSFACSSANNIKRVQGMIERMCREWGAPRECRGERFFAFPRPGALGTERDFRRLGFGFRAPYLAELGRTVKPDWLDSLRHHTYDKARAALMDLPGVSHKVADCVLVFSLGHMEAFPVDVWVRRAALSVLFGGRKASDRAIRQRARERFGPLAGFAQQYLFYEWRQRGRGR